MTAEKDGGTTAGMSTPIIPGTPLVLGTPTVPGPPVLIPEPTEKMRQMVALVEPEMAALLQKFRTMGHDIDELVMFVARYDQPYVPKHEMELAHGRIRIAPIPFQFVVQQGQGDPHLPAMTEMYGKIPGDLVVRAENQGRLALGHAGATYGLDMAKLWSPPLVEQVQAEEKTLQDALRFFLLPAEERIVQANAGKVPDGGVLQRLSRRGFILPVEMSAEEAKNGEPGELLIPVPNGYVRLDVTDEGKAFALKTL